MIKQLISKFKYWFRTPPKVDYPADECEIIHRVIDFYTKVSKYQKKEN